MKVEELSPVGGRRGPGLRLAARSFLWTLLLPGVVAVYVPWTYFGLRAVRPSEVGAASIPGLVAAGAGVLLLAASIVEFARSGRGTLSPADPPRHLVTRGLYRFVRNPMYLSVALILLGEVLLGRSRALALYAVIWFVAVNLFVVAYEEPALSRQFGTEYDEYRRRVPRWIPRVHTG